MRELTELARLTRDELRLAGSRIAKQSDLVLRVRLELRRWRKRWRKMKRAWLDTADHPGRYCEWISYTGADGKLRWRCRWCDCRAIKPTTRLDQRRAGFSCPKAPRWEVGCL